MTLIMIPLGFFLTLLMKEVQAEMDETIILNGFSMISQGIEGDTMFMFIGILATLLFASDFSSGSIRQIIGKGIDRTKYVVGTLVSVSVFVLVMMAALFLSLFLSGSLLGEGIGSFHESNIGNVLLCVLVFGFFYVAYILLIVSSSRKVSISLIAAILTPTILNLITKGITLLTKKNFLFDPLTQMSTALSESATNAQRVTALVCYFIAGLFLCVASIIVIKKRDV